MKHKQFGFGLVEIVIGLVVVGLLIAGGWYVWSRNVNKDDSATTTQEAAAETCPESTSSGKNANYDWSSGGQGPYHDKVSFATSTDLLNWTDSGKILTEHASVPDVVLKDGTLYAYFVDVTTDGKPEQIGLIKSTDNGATWSDREFVTINGLCDKVAVDPDPFLLPDGRIRLYYYDISNRAVPGSDTKNSIYSAVSTDGVTFTEEDGVRFEESSIFDPDVIKVGDTWRLYVGDPGDNKVISATSTDGLNFTKEGTAYSGGAVPNVYFDGSKYYLYTAGINIATSNDGKTFTSTGKSFRRQNGVTADAGVVKLPTGSYLMVYKTSDQMAQGAPPLGTPQ